ncbi:hypothetical protein [Chitinophaga sp. CF418]|uniref:hypothetical protein n=1 Tax=Chitinophaga sp. CF418 TaxID=1855287 RepID=UPI00122D4599|nr:hypothetical protein [Chitinophaga sp. CF418]
MNKLFDYMRDGVSQTERKLEALLPSYVKIDERSKEDLLLFLSNLSSQFNYFNFQHEIEGDWKDFIQADVLIMIIAISRLDFTSWQQQQQEIAQILDAADNDAQLQPPLTDLFNLIYGIAIQLASHLQQLKKADLQGLTWIYTDQLQDSLELDVLHALQFERAAAGLFRNVRYFRSAAITKELQILFPRLINRQNEAGPVFLGYQSLNEIYNNLRSKYYQVTTAAQAYLKRRPDVMEHHPHIGLLMAFTQLYSHLQHKVNGLTGQHLSYYYRNVLGIQQRPAVPDKVHVFVDTMPQSMPVAVRKGTPMIVDPGNGAAPVTYRLDQDLNASQTRLRALQSVYVNSYKQISANNPQQSDIIEQQVYTAIHKVTVPADHLPGALPVAPWPLLGEAQQDLPLDQRTMKETDMGLIIASPLFYLTEGRRTVEISLYCEAASFERLLAYVRNFAAVTGKKEALVMNDLLSSALIISYTTAEGWYTVAKHSIRCAPPECGPNCLVISITYDANAPAAALYNPVVHHGEYQTTLPLIKLLLNNNSFHHPYSYLPLLRLERVAIRANVKGYRSVRLFNNAGPLSPANPFQLFGAQPAVGSFLDIKDSNIFNTYTKAFRFKIEWLELPHMDNGFNAYYDAYDAGMLNDSFKTGISTYEDGQFQPERNKQQLLNLFDTYRDEEGRLILSDTVTLKDLDLKKIRFHNKPLLDKEPFVTDGFYTDGAVRLELAGPQEAFGHKLYLRLFPEVATHNAGRWSKKRPIPNIPYTPLVKSIMVDYILEQAEIMKPEKANDTEQALQLFHLYPYGHRQAYPSPFKDDFALLPSFDDKASLYLGFDQMSPQEDISLLFQMDEKFYKYTTVTKSPKLHWSYLYNDRWVPFNNDQIQTDTTQLFISSGIISMRTPSMDCYGNTRLDKQLQWIRLSATEEMQITPMVKGVFVNAALAVRDQADTAAGTTLPPVSIKSLQQEVRGIQRIWQLFPSFGGRPAETSEEYYLRVSERLRHKKRPTSSIDLIQLVLEAFPEVLIVKCVKGITFSDVQLVIVPKPPEGGMYDSEEPLMDIATMYRINEFVKALLPPYVKVTMHHPEYERLKIICDVGFVKGTSSIDRNYYLIKLQDDIRHYMTPWLYDNQTDVKMGGILYTADILNYIKKLPYIAYVTGFSIVHFFAERDADGKPIHCMLDTAVSNMDYVRASTSEAILIPALHHSIRVLDDWEYRDPEPIGISNVITGEEMIIGQHERTSYREDDDSHYAEGEFISLTIQPK